VSKELFDKGFKYYWVLNYDDTWNDYRKTQQWKNITVKIARPEIVE